MDIEVEVVEIDKTEYIIAGEVKDGSIKYIYLVNEEDPKDFMIRRIKDSDLDSIVELESDEEFDKAVELFKDLFK